MYIDFYLLWTFSFICFQIKLFLHFLLNLQQSAVSMISLNFKKINYLGDFKMFYFNFQYFFLKTTTDILPYNPSRKILVILKISALIGFDPCLTHFEKSFHIGFFKVTFSSLKICDVKFIFFKLTEQKLCHKISCKMIQIQNNSAKC